MRFGNNVSWLVALALGVVLWAHRAGEARAEDVTFHYEVTVTAVDDTGGFLDDLGIEVEVGDVIVGEYTFDSAATDDQPGNAGVGFYWSTGATHARSVDVNGVTIVVPGTRIIVQNDIAGTGSWSGSYFDGYQVYGNQHVASGLVSNLVINLVSVGSTTPFDGGITSDALPLTALDASAFNQDNSFEVAFREAGVLPPVWSFVRGVVTWIGPAVQEVRIDVRPDSDANSVNLKSGGKLPVALMGSDELNVSDVDLSSLRFAGAAVAVKSNGNLHVSVEDVDGDGYDDLLLLFEVQELDLTEDDATATLSGALEDGTDIEGSDSVSVSG